MKPEKQRIAIAEECGWEYDESTRQMVMTINGDICGIDWPSLDAIILAVKSLPRDKMLTVLNYLQFIAINDPENTMNIIALATAEQWSEAFLRGVVRWDECDHDKGYEFNGVGMMICNNCRADITPEKQTK